MNITQIKAAVDAGKSVYWANEGYRVHRDILGQHLITFVPNGSTIGLTDRSGCRLNGAEADFFISGSARGADGEQGGEVRGATSEGHLDLSRFDAAPLIAFTAPKETDYGTETDGRISPRRGADRADQWADAQAGC